MNALFMQILVYILSVFRNILQTTTQVQTRELFYLAPHSPVKDTHYHNLSDSYTKLVWATSAIIWFLIFYYFL